MPHNHRISAVYDKVPHESINAIDPGPTSRKNKAKRSWRAVYLMVAGLFCGMIFAIGHHLLYKYLDGKAIDQVILPQAWVFRVATFLAFLAKVSFALVVGSGFVQRQWLMLHTNSFTIAEIDSVSNILVNILSFFDGFWWIKYPSLAILATICWILPLLPIITPGTLTVVSSLHQNGSLLQVPQLNNYNGTQWTQASHGTTMGPQEFSSTTLLSQIAWATAAQGQILQIPSKFPNETYHVEMVGPAIKCAQIDSTYDDLIAAIQASMAQTMHQELIEILYLSWVGGNEAYALNSSASLPLTLDNGSSDVNKLFIYPQIQTDPTVCIVCKFYNSLYSIDFAYDGGRQEISVRNTTYLDPISTSNFLDSMQTSINATAPNGLNTTATEVGRLLREFSYTGLAAQFGSFFVGRAIKPSDAHSTGTTVEYTQKDLLRINYTADIAEISSSIEELFQNITISLLSFSEFRLNTTETCGGGDEYWWLNSGLYHWDELCKELANQNSSVWVTVNEWLPSYQYSPLDLLLTYGLALIVAVGSLLVGLHAFFLNSGSYQNVFSTFARLSLRSGLQHSIDRDDNCADPRPKEYNSVVVNTSHARIADMSESRQEREQDSFNF